jgi:putative SOS response-associated peptidase YedK
MCHDISFSANSIELITDYLPNLIVGEQNFDFSTTTHVLAQAFRKYPIVHLQDNLPHLKYFEWGVVADYMNTPEKVKEYRSSMVNIRSEKLLDDKRSVWYRLRKQRCLIPVTGFFEHREIKGWTKKVPYHIKLQNRSLFFLLGLYNYSPIPDIETGELKGTFGIVTRSSNTVMSQIHNHGPNKHRMPVILQPEKAVKWINQDLTDEDLRNFLNYSIPDNELKVFPVWTIRTTKERPDFKTKIDPFEWENLPTLGKDDTQLTLL